MFRTGFSGAKVVVKSDHKDLSVIDRDRLMNNVADALQAFGGGMLTGCDLNTCDVSSIFTSCVVLLSAYYHLSYTQMYFSHQYFMVFSLIWID